jgi:membrane-associated protease RseP (regulator of RpoE activity)
MGALFLSVAVFLALSHVPGVFRLVAARLGGMRVDRIVIGVGPVFRRGKWVIGALPIGTYLAIAGRDAVGRPASPAMFSGRPWPWKLLVLLAAPISFYLLAALTMTVSYVAFGVPVDGHRPSGPEAIAQCKTASLVVTNGNRALPKALGRRHGRPRGQALRAITPARHGPS